MSPIHLEYPVRKFNYHMNNLRSSKLQTLYNIGTKNKVFKHLQLEEGTYTINVTMGKESISEEFSVASRENTLVTGIKKPRKSFSDKTNTIRAVTTECSISSSGVVSQNLPKKIVHFFIGATL